MKRLVPLVLLAASCGEEPTAPTLLPLEIKLLPLEINLEAIAFGEVQAYDCEPTQTVRVTNPNDSSLSFQANVEGDDVFEALTDTLSVDAGSTVSFELQFDAPTTGSYQGQLELDVYGDSVPATAPVPLSGTSLDTVVLTDTFVQPAAQSPDLVIVLPDATRMEDHLQDQVLPHITGMMDAFAAQEVDYRIAVVVADPSSQPDGEFSGPTVHPAMDNPLRELRTQLLNGGFWNSHTSPPLLGEAQRGLSAPRGAQADLMRADALPNVLILSDRDDRQLDAPQDHANFLRGLRQNLRDVRFHVIGTNYSDCPYDSTYGSGSGLTETHTLLPATYFNLCDLDSPYAFERVAHSAMGLDGYFPLAGVPNTPTCDGVDVYVDGEWVPCDGWTLRLGHVAFEPHRAPDVGGTVEVRYAGEGSCDRFDQPMGN